MKWSFTIPGEPRGKGRPRFCRIGGGVRTYTDAKTENYEGKLAVMALQNRPPGWPLKGGKTVEVVAYFAVPASATEKKRLAMCATGCTKKPDADNILKAVCDGLNGVAWMDDSAVWSARITKMWSTHPRVEVEIEAADA